MAPGVNNFNPCVLEIILHRGGNILETCTRLHFSIPASRKARSKECNSSLCVPTPFVKNIFLGTKLSMLKSPSSSCERKNFYDQIPSPLHRLHNV
jgi:hypothetical protein